MNNYLFKKDKTIEILDAVKKELIENKKNINKAFDLDLKEWEYKLDFEKIISIIDKVKNKEYLPSFTKEKIVDGIGRIALICNQNPYLIFEFVLSSIYTNNKVSVVLENKLLASNIVLIECIKKVLNKKTLDEDTVEYIQMVNKDKIIDIQDNFDLLYYFGNKEEYLSFIKRIHIDTKFENYGEIYVYVDSKEFKDELTSIDKFAYINEIKVNYYNDDFEIVKEMMNKRNNISKISVIFTKNTDKAYEFIKDIKSEKIYININPCDDIDFNINLNNLVYSKSIVIKK